MYVGTLSLPGGDFLVNVTAVILNSPTTNMDSVTCYLWDGTSVYPLNYGEVTLPASSSYAGSDENIAITAATTVGGTMQVACQQNSPDTGIYADNISITATPVSTLQASGSAALSARSSLHGRPLPQRPRATRS